jgi:hypothetical protein
MVTDRRAVTTDDAADTDVQLELMRRVLRHVALAAPTIDLAATATEIFCRERILAEHYLLHLEATGFVAHAEDERLTSLMPTKEGCTTLLMLEATKPGTNRDLLSPQALHQPDDDQRGWRRLRNA